MDFDFEHKFWLQILGDHSRFIKDSLVAEEAEAILMAKQFISRFDQLLEEARHGMDIDAKALASAKAIFEFKKNLLNRHINGLLNISLPPTFINHMMNENEQYLKILANKDQDLADPKVQMKLHKLWAVDAVGHLCAIAAGLDPVEKVSIKQAKKMKKKFHETKSKALEFIGYLRASPEGFPALNLLNAETAANVKDLIMYFDDIHEILESRQGLGNIPPLMIDHMMREEAYWLMKTQQAAGLPIDTLGVDPAQPRRE